MMKKRPKLPETVKVFSVGGAVRDALLGVPSTDRDYVVVGATPEIMLRAGFIPVGKDFPVFLHPETHEEYALARTERKNGRGYHGFTFHTSPDVTIGDDLLRRDLTINAMAIDENGDLIDPYGGKRDLAAGILRHVSAAFSEDPLRVLRVARFSARFSFFVADETMKLLREITQTGELSTLPAERLWQETARALMTPNPARFLQVLRACGALEELMPEVNALYGVPQAPKYHPEIDTGLHIEMVLDAAARFAAQENPDGKTRFDLPVRYALLCHDLGKALTPKTMLPSHKGHEERGVPIARELSARLKAPQACQDAAVMVTKWHGAMFSIFDQTPEALLRLLTSIDALRRPERLRWLTAASFVDRNSHESVPVLDEINEYLTRALEALLEMDAGAIARQCQNPAEIPATLKAARVEVMARVVFRKDG